MYSRRSILKLFGVAVVGASLPISFRVPDLNLTAASQGRALKAVTVFKKASINAPIVNKLWPDSTVPILGTYSSWYRVPNGFVARAGLQPMVSCYTGEHGFVANQPFWAEVVGPVAPVYGRCAVDAPLVTRIGNGGVSKVIDSLPGEPNGWYGIEDDQGAFLGWTQANRWRPVSFNSPVLSSESDFGNRLLQIDAQTCQLTLAEHGKTIMQAECSVGQAIAPGRYDIQSQEPGGGRWEATNIYQGVPWQTRFGAGFSLAGIYWHNHFGESLSGSTVQVTPVLARWLYDLLGEGSAIIVL